MISFAIFCVQIFFVQYAFCQTITAPSTINSGHSGHPSAFAPNIPGHNAASMAAANMGTGLAGQMMANGIPASAYGQMGAQPYGIASGQMGMPTGIATNQLTAAYGPNYGGSGSGDVAVAGELPVAGTTAISGHVPLSGKVQFTGTLPAGGIVTISGQCGYSANNGQVNVPYASKPGFNNKSYLY